MSMYNKTAFTYNLRSIYIMTYTLSLQQLDDEVSLQTRTQNRLHSNPKHHYTHIIQAYHWHMYILPTSMYIEKSFTYHLNSVS